VKSFLPWWRSIALAAFLQQVHAVCEFVKSFTAELLVCNLALVFPALAFQVPDATLDQHRL